MPHCATFYHPPACAIKSSVRTRQGRADWAPQRGRRVASLAAWFGLVGLACSSPPPPVLRDASAASADAPLVAAQPGAWFDVNGSLTVVGPGKRLRLVLSAPVTACTNGSDASGDAKQAATRASLPFHVLAEACRDRHPSILLTEESETASPSELERSYHEVARCVGSELTLTEGWRPDVVEGADPCPLALGLGWRLPTAQELSGLGLDDRKAIAGALFNTEDSGSFGSLLLYARGKQGELELATLSPNAAEQAPTLSAQKREQPLFGAALRCVRDSAGKAPPLPVLPYAAACLREQRSSKALLASQSVTPPLDLQKVKAWLDSAERQTNMLRSASHLAELGLLLESPTLERLAREGREERALTERYSELAESLDDPDVSSAERQRRREEFAHLRRRLGGQIVQTAERGGGGRTQLAAVLTRLRVLLEAAATPARPQKKQPKLDYEPLLSRLRDLGLKTTP